MPPIEAARSKAKRVEVSRRGGDEVQSVSEKPLIATSKITDIV